MAHVETSRDPSLRRRLALWMPTTAGWMAFAAAALAATGGARPTGLAIPDVVLLAAGAFATAACARRSRTVPLYVGVALAAVSQTAVVPLVIAVVGLLAAVSLQTRWVRAYSNRRFTASVAAGGLAWAGAMGAPGESAGPLWPLALVGVAVIMVSARRSGSESFQHRWNRAATVVGLVVVVGGGIGALSVASVRTDVQQGADRLDAGLDSLRAGDTDEGADQLESAAGVLARADDRLSAPWMRASWIVPGLSQQVRATETATGVARDVAEVAVDTAAEVDLEQFQAVRGRIPVDAVAEVAEPLGEVIAALERGSTEVADFDDAWIVGPLRDELDELQARLADASGSARLAARGVAVVPDLLGAEGPRDYLVLFTSPVEARAHTGFSSSYAMVRFDDGAFEMTEFGTAHDLNAALPPGGVSLDGVDDYLARYERFGVERIWQNITMSPDFPTVAEVAAQLRDASGDGRPDGVLSLNPTAMAALLELTGPIDVPEADITLSAENAEDYLLREQYLTFETDNPQRRDVLEFVAEDAFDRLARADLPGPRGLRRILGPAVEEGDLQFFAFEPDETSFLHELGISGQVEPGDGDFLAVTTTNAAGNKIDLFMERSLSYDVTWDPDTGEIEATATVTLTNTAPSSGLPPYLIGNNLGRRPRDIDLSEGANYTFLTVYSPWTVTAGTLDGQPIGFERLHEFGLNAHSTFVVIDPGETRTVTIDLSGSIDERAYDLRILGQPQARPETVEVTVQAERAGDLDVESSGFDDDSESSDDGGYRGSVDIEAPVDLHLEVPDG